MPHVWDYLELAWFGRGLTGLTSKTTSSPSKPYFPVSTMYNLRIWAKLMASIKSAQWSQLAHNIHDPFTLACYIRQHDGKSGRPSGKLSGVSSVLRWVSMYVIELLPNNQIICSSLPIQNSNNDNSIGPPRQCQAGFMLEYSLCFDELVWW
jgi:hypothetical protein